MAVIHEGENPPYVHSDGRIYRRQEGTSDPIYETHRHTIDALYRKAEEFKEELENFRHFDLEFSNSERELIPYLEMFVNTTPFNHFFIEDLIHQENLKKSLIYLNDAYLIEEDVEGSRLSFGGKIKFDSVNTYQAGISFRYLEGQNLFYNGMTMMIDFFGNLKLLLPIGEKYRSAEDLPDRYLNVLNRSQGQSISSINILDVRKILARALILGAARSLSSERVARSEEVWGIPPPTITVVVRPVVVRRYSKCVCAPLWPHTILLFSR